MRVKLEDIHSLSEFQRNTKKHISRLHKSGNATVLTVNGKADLVVLSASSFQKLVDQIERAEAIVGIQRGLDEAESGKGKPARAVFEKLRKKHKIPTSA